jgi:SAM-dependent methyltransferase
MASRREFEDLLQEAENHPVRGWDFSWLTGSGRFQEEAYPWDYDELVAQRARASPDLLDLGTGGGERLGAFTFRPERTVATESYLPNVGIAARRLRPLGVHLVLASGARDNAAQGVDETKGRLPFRSGSFHLVIDRNEAFLAREVARVLATDGIFLTEQTGGASVSEFERLLALPSPPESARVWGRGLAVEQLASAALDVRASQEGNVRLTFSDVGAIAWYLTAVPWIVPGFSIERFRPQLWGLHCRIIQDGQVRVRLPGFVLEACKPRGVTCRGPE